MTHQVYIAKLLDYYDPFSALDLETNLSLDGVEPLAEHTPPVLRDQPYHPRRIKFFVDELKAGHELDPIEVDNQGDSVEEMTPVVIDGHHRLIAAILEQQETIQCTYGGRIDYLEEMMKEKELKFKEDPDINGLGHTCVSEKDIQRGRYWLGEMELQGPPGEELLVCYNCGDKFALVKVE